MFVVRDSIDLYKGPGGSMSWVVGLPNNSYKPITNRAWVRARLCKLQKGCTRLAAASDKVFQLLAHGRWFSPGTPISSTTKTGRHDIAEILLKVALNTKHQSTINQSIDLWKRAVHSCMRLLNMSSVVMLVLVHDKSLSDNIFSIICMNRSINEY
jgi:hypothetical protein